MKVSLSVFGSTNSYEYRGAGHEGGSTAQDS